MIRLKTDEEIEILRNDQVTVVYNPQSNMKLASGVAPISRMLEKDINVCIGTDGPSSNNDLDMWDEMRTGALLQKVATGDPRALPAEAVFRMGTVDAAKAIGHAGELGIVAEGALADLILVDLDRIPSNVNSVKFIVTIDKAIERRQNFGQVRQAYIRVVNDDTGEELCIYRLNEEFDMQICVEIAELKRAGSGWEFTALGKGTNETLENILMRHGVK